MVHTTLIFSAPLFSPPVPAEAAVFSAEAVLLPSSEAPHPAAQKAIVTDRTDASILFDINIKNLRIKYKYQKNREKPSAKGQTYPVVSKDR
jgi:hypothetical protein